MFNFAFGQSQEKYREFAKEGLRSLARNFVRLAGS